MPQVTLTYGDDNAGNRASLTDSKGGLTSYTYDSRDELTTLKQSGTGVTAKRADFVYDNAGRLSSLTRYSDLAGTTTVLATAYAYDQANRLTTITHETALSGGTVRASYSYTLDAASRLTSEARTWNSGASSDTVSYGYTNNNQLTSVSHTNSSFANESFSYDNNGNRNSTGYTTGTGNRSSSDGTYNYAYDDEGNETLRTNISTGAQTLYKWDYRNRLTEVDSVVSGVNTVLATYTYDALDRRIGVTESGATRWTLYDGNSAVLDFNGSGTQTARYLNGPTAAGVDAVMARETLGGTVAWYLPDRLGTIRDLIDNSGNVIDHIDYGVFGNVQGESSPSNRDGFKYAGMRYDSTIGLYFDQARWYDPTSGRFVSIDPVGFAAGDADLYRYVGNGPTIYFDPSGLSGVSPEQCKKWQEQLQKLQDLLKKEQAKYDPDGDKIGGFPGRHGTTKPGGHAKEMADLQRGIDNLLDKLSRFCGGGSGPKPGSSNPPPSMRARTPDDDVRDQIMSDLRNRPPLVFQCEPGFLLPPVAPPTVVEDPVKGPKGPRYPRTPLRRQRPVGTPMRPVRR